MTLVHDGLLASHDVDLALTAFESPLLLADKTFLDLNLQVRLIGCRLQDQAESTLLLTQNIHRRLSGLESIVAFSLRHILSRQ